eukprot:TRINITY_DN9839_c0_g1_i1.p1 TRINITY_DN9839_c0_g1~~TRINITY_DN9839_c0_g1_i1.p1  ORF type:complete len:80 (+),score=18.28 TRINITY_DN9839_c0_g1_i1:67-306(+)
MGIFGSLFSDQGEYFNSEDENEGYSYESVRKIYLTQISTSGLSKGKGIPFTKLSRFLREHWKNNNEGLQIDYEPWSDMD